MFWICKYNFPLSLGFKFTRTRFENTAMMSSIWNCYCWILAITVAKMISTTTKTFRSVFIAIGTFSTFSSTLGPTFSFSINPVWAWNQVYILLQGNVFQVFFLHTFTYGRYNGSILNRKQRSFHSISFASKTIIIEGKMRQVIIFTNKYLLIIQAKTWNANLNKDYYMRKVIYMIKNKI